MSETLAAQQESFRDALLALFAQTLSKSSYSELSAAQADLVPFLHSLVESTNFDLTDKDSSINWVKENLDKTLLEIAKDFNYELDATSAERFAVEHKEVLLVLIDQQQDIDRPSY